MILGLFCLLALCFCLIIYLYLTQANLRDLITENKKSLQNFITEKENIFAVKEKEIAAKYNLVAHWSKYLETNIGDLVYFEMSLTRAGGTPKEIKFTTYVEAEIIDLTSTKAKIKVVNFTTSSPSIGSGDTGVLDYINNNNCWVSLGSLSRRISQADKRDMQLNKIFE